MKKNVVRILTAVLMLSMVFSSSVFAAEKTSAWDSFVGLFAGNANTATNVGVEYRGHVQNKGDFPLDGSWIQGPTQLGTVGEGLRLEAFWIKLTNAPAGLHIKYQVHVQNKGWMDAVEDGTLGGTQGEGLRIEAIKISLVDDNGNVSGDYKVEYRGHVQNVGDTAWYENGAQLGTTGSGLRLEALEVKIVKLTTDMTAYNAALAAVTEDDYTADSWADYKAVVDANVMTAADTQSEVDAATAAIIAAQADLVKLGSSTVIPTSIALDQAIVQAKVGTDVTLTATVEVPAGASKENIPVSFSVDAPVGSINGDFIKEAVTNADGVATLVYNRASAGTDLIEVYPTKNATIRDTANVFWGVDNVLTVTPDNTTAAANGTAVNYTVTVMNPLNNVALQGAVVNVTFLENINSVDGTTANDTTAVIADPNTGGLAVTPFQAATNEKAFTVTTNANGQATFTVTGANTTATPIAFVDSNAAVAVDAGIAGNGNNRIEASELQKQVASLVFTGAQSNYTFDFSPMTAAEYASGLTNARKYTAVVKKADGSVYANAAVKVALDQLIDNNLFTSTSALISATANGFFGTDTLPLTTDANGSVSFYVAEPNDNKSNVNATPAIWIDMDAAGFTNGVRETGEPQALAPTTTFQAQLAQGSNLTINTNPAVKAGPFVDDDVINARFEIRNQSNALSTTAGFNRVTYTITNTSGAAITLLPFLTDATSGFDFVSMTYTFAYGTGTDETFFNGSPIILNAGSSVTIAGTAPGFAAANAVSSTNVANLSFFGNEQDNELTISANGTTVKANLNSDVRNIGSVSQSAQTIVIKDATQADGLQNYTGEIIGYTIADQNTTDNFGRIVVKLDGSGDIVWYNYGTNVDALNIMQNLLYLGTDGTFAFPDTNFNKIFDYKGVETVVTQKAAFDKFEKALTIGNRISFDNTGGATLPTFYLANIKGAAGSASGNDLSAIVIPVGANIATAIAQDLAPVDGVVDTVTLTFEDLNAAALDVVDSSVSITDFIIEQANVVAYSTGAVANDNTIVLTVTPAAAAYNTAPIGNIDFNGEVAFANGATLNVGSPGAAVADQVAPRLLSANIASSTFAAATLTANGGNPITVTLIDAAYTGAFGNTATLVVLDGLAGPATAAYAAGVLTVDLAQNTLTLADLVSLINTTPVVNAAVVATLPVTSNGNDQVTEATVAPIAFTGGADNINLTFSENTFIAANGVTFNPVATGAVDSGDGSTVVTYTLNTAVAKVTTGNVITPVAGQVTDAAGNAALVANTVTLP